MTAPSPLQSLDLPPGTEIGKYEILRKLAAGGMAEIYLARARGAAGFEKVVVLKRILPSVAMDPNFVRMFLDEARIAATLQHPNIADTYDVGDIDGFYFFTMEFIHGQDVRSLKIAARKRGELVPLGVSLAIIHGTLSALDYAHQVTSADGTPRGLVHRDISGSNILISYDGAVKLVDFGIAKATGRETKTRTGVFKGKINYTAPEVFTTHTIDRRSDLFSLGVVMFELTVGRRPFRGETDYQLMEQIVRGSAPRPSSIRADYPPELERIVLKMLAPDPALRYASAEEVLHDLEELLTAHQLWMSSKRVSKYLRTVFADEIAAWEQAERDGVPLAEHVSVTIPSHSGQSDILTEPSALQALPPATKDMRAVHVNEPVSPPTNTPPAFGRAPTPTPWPSDTSPVASPAPSPTPWQPSPPSPPTISSSPPEERSRRTITVLLVAATALVLGGVGALLLKKRDAGGSGSEHGALDHPTGSAAATETAAPPPAGPSPQPAPPRTPDSTDPVAAPPAPEQGATRAEAPVDASTSAPPSVSAPVPETQAGADINKSKAKAKVRTVPTNTTTKLRPDGGAQASPPPAWDPNSPTLPIP